MRFLPLAPRPDRFLPALEAILRGFATNALLHHCSPLQYMRIVSALALAVDAKMAALPTRAPAFVSALQQVFTRVLADQRGRPALPSQLFLAFAAVVLHADPASRKDESAAARPTSTSAESAISFVRKTVAELQQPLANFSEQPELLCFESRNRSTIATVFVVCTIPRFVADYLPPAQIALIRRALELCMRTSLNQPEQIPSTHFVFHKQLCKCISEYPTTLASAHAQFIHTERACETNVHFLTNLAEQGATSNTICRFVYTAVTGSQFTSHSPVAYVSVLSLINVNSSLLLRAAVRRLAPSIARDTQALGALVKLSLVILVSRQRIDATENRAVFVLRFMSHVLAKRVEEETSVQTSFSAEALQELWISLAKGTIACIERETETETIVFAIVECLAHLTAQKEAMFKAAQDYLLRTLPKVMLEKYLFRDMPKFVEKRILHVAIALDALSKAACDKRAYETLSQAITKCADHVESGSRAERLVGVFVLRCLTRCSEQVVNVALDKMTSFIATNKQRKAMFLPLVRAAVLGMDTAKKDVCVEWMMRVFGDMTQAHPDSVITADAVETMKSRLAKL